MTVENTVQKRKLIEVALPLEAINRESTRENFIYKRNPSSIHKWWAQRPLAATRAILFAQLVDDPSSKPEEFSTEELQREERDRLHRLIERLIVWENSGDENLLAQAHAEIIKSTDGRPPRILDPFAGGGTIPLEAQRLGLETSAADLNPVAVLINKALIEIPPTFVDLPPTFPGLADSEIRHWRGSAGLAADVRAYGAWIRDEAEKRVGHLYPNASLPDGSKAPAIAWIWARTVVCPNPACGINMPLVRSWWLGTRKGREAIVEPTVDSRLGIPADQRVTYIVKSGAPPGTQPKLSSGTVGRGGAHCIACGSAVELKYVRAEASAGRMGTRMLATVVAARRSRFYLTPDADQIDAATAAVRPDLPDAYLPTQAPSFRVQAYGFATWADMFTDRQLATLTTLCDLVGEARDRAINDGATTQRADAIATYLGLAVSKTADYSNSFAVWYPKEDRPKNLFAAQSIPMVWDFPEQNPLTDIGGSFQASVRIVSEAFESLRSHRPATVRQANAADSVREPGIAIATDPPYYDNIGYSDLSDFFYVWIRRALRPIYPDLLSTMLVPKADELVANEFRHNGKQGARQFFESGFRSVFTNARTVARSDVPITVWYAFKQSEANEDGTASKGWETILDAIIQAGWEITSTWPIRSERGERRISLGTNALASAIVLSLRPRSELAPTVDRRSLLSALEAELPTALRRLQQGQLAPVDLPQAAIGPGIAVFSRYAAILEPDGTKMSVRSALARINEILDQVLNEQEGDFDSTSRFAIAWYRQHGYGVGKFGDADNLARARNTSVDAMERDEVLTSRAGDVQLIKPTDLASRHNERADHESSCWATLHQLVKILDSDGIAASGEFLRTAVTLSGSAVDADLIKELAHLLFRVAEMNGWTKDALSFNTLVTSWPEIMEAARSIQIDTEQSAFSFEVEES